MRHLVPFLIVQRLLCQVFDDRYGLRVGSLVDSCGHRCVSSLLVLVKNSLVQTDQLCFCRILDSLVEPLGWQLAEPFKLIGGSISSSHYPDDRDDQKNEKDGYHDSSCVPPIFRTRC